MTLAYGVMRGGGVCARTEGRVLDLSGLDPVFDAPSLNGFMARGPDFWRATSERLNDGDDVESATLAMPFEVADYVDFYSSLAHATNLGRMFRPDSEPLLPNWRHLPVGYHGRSGTVVPSGTPVRRPRGQRPGPVFGPSQRLDIELEAGFVIGLPSRIGEPVAIERALDHVFGMVLVNDWSARDIQAWEYQPLGPFLGKSFATSVSHWVVPLSELAGRRVAAEPQEPEPLPYLREEPWAYDIPLEVELNGTVIARSNTRHLYWSIAQQIAHLTANGASLRTGDLLATGTISGPEREESGSLIELSWNGEEPIELADGSTRTFLEDGDEVVLRGEPLGEVRGRIEPAWRFGYPHPDWPGNRIGHTGDVTHSVCVDDRGRGAPSMTRRLARLADLAYRRRGRMVLAWIAALVVIIGVGSSLAGEYDADYNTPGSESKAASDLTEERFEGYSGQEIYVVWKDPDGAASPAARERVDAFLAEAKQVDNVAEETPIRVSEDGTIGATTLPLTVAGWDVPKEDGEKLIAAAEENSGAGLEIKLGGDPIYAAQETTSPEGLGFLGAAIVLLIAFGSVVAAGLPLVIALVGLGISSGGLILLLANVVDVPDWTTAVSGLIGIGVGIDYALLVLTRFRAAMNDGKDRHDAVVEAVSTAGRSVVIAGGTVVIAVLGLLLTGLPYMYGVAIAASLAVLVVMLASITLLPALLSYLGPKVDRLRLPFLGRTLRPEGNGESLAGRWSHAVQRRPWVAAIAATAVLLALAAPALDMRLGFPDAGNDPPDTMTRQAYDLNTEGFGPGTNGPLVIAADLPEPGAEARIDSLAERLRDERGIAFVTDPQVNGQGDAAIVNVIPTTSPQESETEDLVNRLRTEVVPEELDGSGIRAEVGGVTAALEDQSDYITDRMPVFIAGVVGLSFLLLLVAFRAPLISLKAGVMNLLSVGAAYGVMTLVAKGGTVGELIGIDHEVPIAPFMPVMMFAILFGLSMDYEVFLISRIREEYLKHGDTRRAVADGLAKTARVITAAAAIMVVVFLAFLAAPDVFLKLFGIGLAAAIFFDATIVRMVLVPAVMQLLGSRNWWIPSWLERVLPELDVEPSRLGTAQARP